MAESQRSDDRSQARSEAAALLGIDIANPSPADSLRIDMVSSLRLVIDHEQASVLSGSSADLGKLNIAVQSLIALLPGRELPSPSDNHPDPREVMWRIYSEMRTRGEVPPEGWHQHRINELEAEVATLRAQLVGAGLTPALSDVADRQVGTSGNLKTVITPTEADITPPSELGKCHIGMNRGPDDPPMPRVIEGKANPPAPPAPEPWQDWLDAGGHGGPGYDRWADNR